MKREWTTLGDAEKGTDVWIFILVNVLTGKVHLADNDVIDGWAGMTILGHFTDSHLYVSDLDARLPHRRRDDVLLQSRILRHFSQPFRIVQNLGRYVLFHKKCLII